MAIQTEKTKVLVIDDERLIRLTLNAKLKQIGFEGPIGIDGNRPGDRYWYAKEDLAYFKAVRDAI